MTQTIHCSGCDRDLSSDEFSWKYKTKGIRQRWCKSCQAEANKIHYQNNTQIYKDRAIDRNQKIRTDNRQKLYEYLLTHPCVDCGKTDVRCLEFDHINGNKSADVSRLLDTAPGPASNPRSPNAKSVVPTATVSKPTSEQAGGEL